MSNLANSLMNFSRLISQVPPLPSATVLPDFSLVFDACKNSVSFLLKLSLWFLAEVFEITLLQPMFTF